MNDTTYALFTPRTFGDDLWVAVGHDTRCTLPPAVRPYFVTAANAALSQAGDIRSLRDLVGRRMSAENIEFLQGYIPSGEYTVTDGDAMSTYRAIDRFADEDWTIDSFPTRRMLGNTYWTNNDLWDEYVAWAADVRKPLPTFDSPDNPADQAFAHMQSTVLGRNVGLLGDAHQKAIACLFMQEKVRAGFDSPAPEEPPLVVQDACYTCMQTSPAGARIDEGDIVKVTYAPVRHGESIRVLRWQDGEWTDGNGSPWYVRREHLSLLSVPDPSLDIAVAPVDEAPAVDMAEVASLRDRITRLNAENERLRTWQNNAVSDVEKASQELIAQADRRGWCSEYDEIIDRINGQMTVISFDEREQEFEVEVTWTATISGSTTVTVTARSQEDAEEQVSDSPSDFVDLDSYTLSEAARYNGCNDVEYEVQ